MMILKFNSNMAAWTFIKTFNANRPTIMAPVPWAEDKTPKPQKLFANLEQSEEEMNHSSAVGMAARALYMLKDEKKIIDAHTIIECNYGNVNKKKPGHIIM